MMIALCVILPMAFHFPQAGMLLLPMHIPVLLAGLICGPLFGLAAGVLGPFISSFTGMPPVPLAYLMMFELGLYGFTTGIVMKFVRTKSAALDLYISLIASMLIGRVFSGILQVYVLGDFNFMERGWGGAGTFTWGMWITIYFATALPGIIIQLAFIPSVVIALEREKVIPSRYAAK
jgi:hypothetical protein